MRLRLFTMLLTAALAASTAGAQSTQPADAMTVAQGALTQLDQLRVVGSTDARRVSSVLYDGSNALVTFRDALSNEQTEASTNNAQSPDNLGATAVRRARLCQIAFMQAELHRRSAVALSIDDAQRIAQLETALSDFRKLRVDYRDLAVGLLGYAGESRVHRARNDLSQADKVLATVALPLDDRRLPQQAPAAMSVQRVLWMERVENALASDPAEAKALVAKIGSSALMESASSTERSALQWLGVRAEVASLVAGRASDSDAVVAAIRDTDWHGAVREDQRVAELNSLAAKKLAELTPGEDLIWARLQAWAGLDEAAAARLAQVAAAAPESMTAADWQTYGSLLYRTGQIEASAVALANALASITPDSPQYAGLLQTIAVGRLKAAQAPDSTPEQNHQAAETLIALASSTKDSKTRLDALRSWTHLQQTAGTLPKERSKLDAFAEDVQSDPYLTFSVAHAKIVADRDATTQPARHDIATIQSDLERVLPSASADLAPSIVLLLVQLKASAPEGGARAALDLLNEHEPSLKPDAPATPQLRGLKLALLMELGLTNDAEALAATIDTASMESAALQKLAALVADRYVQASGSTQQQADIRSRVVQWTTAGLTAHRGHASYESSALAAARTLLRVEAFADAENILTGLRTSQQAESVREEANLLTIQALVGQKKIDEAREALDAIVKHDPESAKAQLARGELERSLHQWASAAAAYREARNRLPDGGKQWWQATMGLAESLEQQGNIAAAQQLVRIANALYRKSAPAQLLPKIDTLLKQAAPTSAARGGKNG